jgi:DNA-directed RNA polymerase subunit K/omega
MVPITTIDYEGVVPNRFELVLHAATRARVEPRGNIASVARR